MDKLKKNIIFVQLSHFARIYEFKLAFLHDLTHDMKGTEFVWHDKLS